VGVPEALSKWFCLHSPQYCAEGIHCLITCDEWMNLQDDCFGEVGHCSLFSFSMLKLLNEHILSMYCYFLICPCNLSAVIHLSQYAW
jgi:hypothetical protein